MKDIEETPFIRPDGKIVIRVNKIDYSSSDTSEEGMRPLSEEEMNEILRKRGYK